MWKGPGMSVPRAVQISCEGQRYRTHKCSWSVFCHMCICICSCSRRAHGNSRYIQSQYRPLWNLASKVLTEQYKMTANCAS